MTDLLAAIKTAFTASLSAQITGGIWLDEIPPRNAMPYCRVKQTTPGKLVYTFGTPYFEPVNLQFMILAPGNDSDGNCEALVLAEAFTNAFDNLVLTVSGIPVAAKRVQAIQVTQNSAKDASGKPVYQALCVYRFVARRYFPR